MDWMAHARRQDGLITRGQMLAAGLTDSQVRRMVTSRELRRVYPGVFLHGSMRPSLSQRTRAAAIWSGAVVSHESAAAMWNMDIPWLVTSTVHITVPHQQKRRVPGGIRVHRLPLRAEDVILGNGIRMTTRARTTLELIRAHGPVSSTSFFDRQLQLEVIAPAAVLEDVERYPGRDGNTALRRLVSGHLPGAEAESERRMHRLLRRHGFAGWEPQFWLQIAGRWYRFDIAFPASRLAVLVDGFRFHDPVDRRDHDGLQDIDVQRIGWRIARVGWRRLEHDGDGVVRDLTDLLRIRRLESA